jgi:hypothetical protein
MRATQVVTGRDPGGVPDSCRSREAHLARGDSGGGDLQPTSTRASGLTRAPPAAPSHPIPRRERPRRPYDSGVRHRGQAQLAKLGAR